MSVTLNNQHPTEVSAFKAFKSPPKCEDQSPIVFTANEDCFVKKTITEKDLDIPMKNLQAEFEKRNIALTEPVKKALKQAMINAFDYFEAAYRCVRLMEETNHLKGWDNITQEEEDRKVHKILKVSKLDIAHKKQLEEGSAIDKLLEKELGPSAVKAYQEIKINDFWNLSEKAVEAKEKSGQQDSFIANSQKNNSGLKNSVDKKTPGKLTKPNLSANADAKKSKFSRLVRNHKMGLRVGAGLATLAGLVGGAAYFNKKKKPANKICLNNIR